MASEQRGVSAVPALSATRPESATIAVSSTITPPDPDTTRSKSLKRSRPDQSQGPTALSSIANIGLSASPSPKSPRYKGAFSPMQLTGAAALEDQRRQQETQKNQQPEMSINPGHKALSSLMVGGGAEMSKPQEAPAAINRMSEGMSAAANAVSLPSPMHFDEKSEISPASITSLASLGTTAPTATAGSTVVASPASLTSAIEAENRDIRVSNNNHLQAPLDEQSSNKAMSYPGNALGQQNLSRAPPRGMSLPMPGQTQQLAPRSPSQKKHKCPYCETDFTRHHNLKSHLLTHSQEKPYVCQTCSMRFRRLHDLKRHMKLHTGERPHICPKCDRKFARGDALARHSKGQGGCAGRRASMGSFGGDDDYEGSNGDGDESAMDGVMYTNGTQPNESEMTEEERRRFSLPSIKAQHVVSNQDSGDNYTAHPRTPSTYPPSGPRQGQSIGGLYPPNPDRGGPSGSGTSPRMQNSGHDSHTPTGSLSSLPLNTTGSSIFSQSGMTESPKPLSPAGMHSHQLGHDPSINRQRSPSLTTQFQQQHFGRRPSGRGSPPGVPLPSPHTSHVPKLPAISSLAPPDQRYTLSSQTPNQQTSPNGSHGGQQQHNSAAPSNTMFQSSQGLIRGAPTGPPSYQGSASGDSSANLFAAGDTRVLAYVQSLEDKVKQLSEKIQVMESKERSQEDKINRLSNELFSLRNQFTSAPDQPPVGQGSL
ncbi:Transcriptional regulator CRZ1 [Lachnellula cervina]|uniref:Transcriptional regulator CRZ1 n=1 Tax=Lachnellula cervina TaxID=1316786 RepID=A0A7D8ULC4_9HELO|nr:Transcriptional regulator CRZ1 [Lachnellula cervina]